MSVRTRRSGLVIAWSRTLTILSPWKRGKADTVVDGEVVLTKVKVLSRSQRNLLLPSDPSCISSALDSESSTQNQLQPSDSNPTTQSLPLDSVLWGKTEDQLDSEDSGLDSPSSPLRSHKSLVHDTHVHKNPVHSSPVHNSPVYRSSVHSRGSSCDSGNSYQTLPHVQDTEEMKKHPNKHADLTEIEETGLIGGGTGLKDDYENPLHRDGTKIWSSDESEFMEACCSLQTQSLSGLGYLEQVCKLVERISRLQDLVLHLQRELRAHRSDCNTDQSLDQGLDQRLDLTSLMQRCTCGAADLLLSPVQTQDRTKSSSRTNLDRDLSQDQRAITESSPRIYSCRESAPCRRRRGRRSLDEDCPNDGHLHRELSERSSSSWGRVQDLVMTRTRSKFRLRSGSLKTSCPQLHRSDQSLDPIQLRGSMILLSPDQ